MELKLDRCLSWNKPYVLLIVPYGIETCHCEAVGEGGAELLIVPYGIETVFGTFEADEMIHF